MNTNKKFFYKKLFTKKDNKKIWIYIKIEMIAIAYHNIGTEEEFQNNFKKSIHFYK